MKSNPLQATTRLKPPFFRPGQLIFLESGHTLTHGKGYICSLKQKGRCKLEEQSVKVEAFEKRFSRFAKSFEIPKDSKWPAVKHVVGRIMHDQVDDFLESDDFHDEIIESSLIVAKQSLEDGDTKQYKSDLKDAEKYISKESQEDPTLFSGLLLGTIMLFAKSKVSEADTGRSLAYLSEKIYFDNDCNILKIKLYPLADYIFQYMERNISGFKKSDVFIKRIHFDSLDYKVVAKKIRANNMPDFIVPPLAKGYDLVQLSKRIYSKIDKIKPDEAIKLLWELQNSPLGRMMLNMNKLLK